MPSDESEGSKTSRELLASWNTPLESEPDDHVYGSDALLAAAVQHLRGDATQQPILTFHPTASDLARAVGIFPEEEVFAPAQVTHTQRIALDAIHEATRGLVVNHVLLGTPPDFLSWGSSNATIEVVVDDQRVFSGRASSVVIANGQYLRGNDLVPKGHPADGRLEVQIYHLRRAERRGFRDRLHLGTHLPHPRITEARGAHVVVTARGRPFPIEADGGSWGSGNQLEAQVQPHAYCLTLP